MKYTVNYTIKLCCYLIVPFCVFGCGVTPQQLRNQYQMKPMNKALASGKDKFGNEILGASWGFGTDSQAKERALIECYNRGVDCKIIDINDSPYISNINGTYESNSNFFPKNYSKSKEQSSHLIEYTCSELSKSEAYSLLSQGHTYLDKDGDGHPCEWGQRKIYTPSRSYNSGNCYWVKGYYRRNGTYVKGHKRCR